VATQNDRPTVYKEEQRNLAGPTRRRKKYRSLSQGHPQHANKAIRLEVRDTHSAQAYRSVSERERRPVRQHHVDAARRIFAQLVDCPVCNANMHVENASTAEGAANRVNASRAHEIQICDGRGNTLTRVDVRAVAAAHVVVPAEANHPSDSAATHSTLWRMAQQI
jgi:preprotein translocase subunit SecD